MQLGNTDSKEGLGKGGALTIFPRNACELRVLAYLGPPKHPFWDSEFSPP